jgi:hypothetical protein
MYPTQEEISNFSKEIETIVIRCDIPYMEAIVMHCEKTGLEIEIAARLCSANIKSFLREEAENLHFIPRENSRLPL